MDAKQSNKRTDMWHENINNDPYDEYRDAPQGCFKSIVTAVAVFALAVIAIFMFACRAQQPTIVTTEVEKVVEIHTRDTAFVTKADSASLQALLQCDSNYNVILTELVTMQGERIKAALKTKNEGNAMVIEMDCKEDSLLHEIQLRDSVISTFQKDTQIIKEQYVPDYYKNTSMGFWVLLALVLVVVVCWVAKIIIKIKTGGIL